MPVLVPDILCLFFMTNRVRLFKSTVLVTSLIVGSLNFPNKNTLATSVPEPPEVPVVVEEKKYFHELIEPLGDLLSQGEGDWNSVNRGYAGDTPGGIQRLTGKTFNQYTVGQVVSMQRGWLYAVGRYQFVPRTLRFAVSHSTVKYSDKFDRVTQNKLLAALVEHKRPLIGGFLKGEHGSINSALRALAREWASVEYLGYGRGYGYYNHIGGNRAHITIQQAVVVLNDIRKQILNI